MEAGRTSEMKEMRALFSKKTIGHDAVAGVVLGVESVPDGLAGVFSQA